jgi:hypothetical protein
VNIAALIDRTAFARRLQSGSSRQRQVKPTRDCSPTGSDAAPSQLAVLAGRNPPRLRERGHPPAAAVVEARQGYVKVVLDRVYAAVKITKYAYM